MNRKTPRLHKATEGALQHLEALIREVHESNDPTQHSAGFSSIFRSGEFGEFGLNEKQSDQYLSILDRLSPDEGIPPSRSRAEMDRALVRCILSALTPTTESETSFDARTKQSISELRTGLTSVLKEWEICRFINGIKAPPGGFRFGKFLFSVASDEPVRAMYSKILKLARRDPAKRLGPKFAGAWPEKIANSTVCTIVLKAGDRIAADELAKFELEITLEVLNFFASLIYPSERWPRLTRNSEVPARAELHIYSRVDSGEFGSHTIPVRCRETFDPTIVSQDKDIELAFSKASQLLGAPSGALHERFLAALKWAGKGSVTKKRENAFVSYAIALEALLLGQKHHEQLGYKLRLRAAHVYGLNNSARATTRDRVNRLYSLRSKIVHSGRTELPQADLDELRLITQSCLIVCWRIRPSLGIGARMIWKSGLKTR
jgi:hypothetical protein